MVPSAPKQRLGLSYFTLRPFVVLVRETDAQQESFDSGEALVIFKCLSISVQLYFSNCFHHFFFMAISPACLTAGNLFGG